MDKPNHFPFIRRAFAVLLTGFNDSCFRSKLTLGFEFSRSTSLSEPLPEDRDPDLDLDPLRLLLDEDELK